MKQLGSPWVDATKTCLGDTINRQSRQPTKKGEKLHECSYSFQFRVSHTTCQRKKGWRTGYKPPSCLTLKTLHSSISLLQNEHKFWKVWHLNCFRAHKITAKYLGNTRNPNLRFQPATFSAFVLGKAKLE